MKQNWKRIAVVSLLVLGLFGLTGFIVACGGANSSSKSTRNPTPAITSLSPSSTATGSSSESITINGTGFLASSTVTFNGVVHGAVYVGSTRLAISLTSADLAKAGNYPVVVTNPAPGGGASAAVNFDVISNNPVPTIATLSPEFLVVGATPQTLTINGTEFLASSTVTFNGVAHIATYVSATQLTISLTAADLGTTGNYPVIVTNPTPGGGASGSLSFGIWKRDTFLHTGIQISVPPNLTPHESNDPVSKQVVFLNSGSSSDGDILLTVQIEQLPQGLSLTDAIQNGGVDSSSISQVSIGDQTYLYWFSSGEGDGNWNYASICSPGEVVTISTPSSSFAAGSIIKSVIGSLAFPAQ